MGISIFTINQLVGITDLFFFLLITISHNTKEKEKNDNRIIETFTFADRK